MKIPRHKLDEFQKKMRHGLGELNGLDAAIEAAIERLPEGLGAFTLFIDADEKGNARVRSIDELPPDELEEESERIAQLLAERAAQRRVADLRQKGLKRSEVRRRGKKGCCPHKPDTTVGK